MAISSTLTGNKSVCRNCGSLLVQMWMLHGRSSSGHYWPGFYTWLSPDQGNSSAKCHNDPDGPNHEAAEAPEGSAFAN